MSVRILRKNPGWLEKLVRAYGQEAELAIGWPRSSEGAAFRYPKTGVSILLVAAVNNFGSASRGIPARPFMSESAQPAVVATEPIATIMIRAINRGKATIEDALKEMGPYAVGAFQTTITDHAWVPNKQSTIDRKGSARPLIEDSHLRNTLSFVVRRPDA